MNMVEIKKMDTVERLQTMEAIWSSLLYDETEMESPEWHRSILSKRKRKINKGKAEFISIKDLKTT